MIFSFFFFEPSQFNSSRSSVKQDCMFDFGPLAVKCFSQTFFFTQCYNVKHLLMIVIKHTRIPTANRKLIDSFIFPSTF